MKASKIAYKPALQLAGLAKLIRSHLGPWNSAPGTSLWVSIQPGRMETQGFGHQYD